MLKTLILTRYCFLVATCYANVLQVEQLSSNPSLDVVEADPIYDRVVSPRPYQQRRRVQQRVLPPPHSVQYAPVVEVEERIRPGNSPPLPCKEVIYNSPCDSPPDIVTSVPPIVLSSPPASPSRPPVQFLPNCDMFPMEWPFLLQLINKYRQEKLSPSCHDLCMNAKLMQAAKLQSDFQALARLPTHSGPRLSGFGDLAERLWWFNFSTTAPTTKPEDEGLNGFNLPLPTRKTPPLAQELIYYWPVGPRTLTTTMLRHRLEEAWQAWLSDPWSASVLADPRWQFFGFGYYRSQMGTTYLTAILAASPTEVCNVCASAKDIIPPSGGNPSENFIPVMETLDEEYSNLFI